MKTCKFCKKPILKCGVTYCSLACANRGNPRVKKQYHRKICPCCKKAFVVDSHRIKNIYCSHSCAAKEHNQRMLLDGRIKSAQTIDCKQCGKKVSFRSHRNGYCSTDCRRKTETELWLARKLDGCHKYGIASYAKRFVWERAHCQCERCGEKRTRGDGSFILAIHHKDGNWKNNCESNLELICPTCHALTDNYGARNYGKGRKWKGNYKQFAVLT